MREILSIDESKVKITGKAWDADGVRELAAKKIFQFQKCVEYWRPLLERGRMLESRFEGDIFTERQREAYLNNDIIPLESPIAKAPIRALAGQVIKSRKSGEVVSERSSIEAEDNSDELRVVNAVMKDIEVKTREEHQISDAVTSALVTGWWNVLMFDHDRPSRNSDGLRYKMRLLPWNSCVFGPTTVREPDGGDIKELFFFDYRTVADLVDNYPAMEKQIKEHFDPNRNGGDSWMLSSLRQWEDSMTSDDRDMMYDVLRGADEACSRSGMAKVVMHLYPIKRKEEVWVNMYDSDGDDVEIRPPDWDDERWAQWVQDNRGKFAGPYEKEVITLWMTVFTTSGLVLANEPHWFQENGMLPCSFWLGAVSSNQPTGPMVDMNMDVLCAAVAETEFLNDTRRGTTNTMVLREGVISNMEHAAEELVKPLGVLGVKADYQGPLSDVVQQITRAPNDIWKVHAEHHKQGMLEVTRINEAMLGQYSPRQSAIAKESEISQSLSVNAIYVDNVNRSWQRHQNLKLKLIPYFYQGWEVLEVVDEESGEKQVFEVNAPAEYDNMGNVVRKINDLITNRYGWKIEAGDSSANAKVRAVEEALVIVNAIAGPLAQADPTGMMLAEFLAAIDNPLLKKSGKRMAQAMQQSAQAQAAEEKQKSGMELLVKLTNARAALQRAHKSGMFLNFKAEDLSNYPQLLDLFIQFQQISAANVDRDFQVAQQTVEPQGGGADMAAMMGGGQGQGQGALPPPQQEQEQEQETAGPPPVQEPVAA